MRTFPTLLMLAILALLPATTTAQDASGPGSIPWITVKQANEAAHDQYVFVRGRVISIMPPRANSTQPWSIYVSDATGQVRVVIFQDTWKALGSVDFIAQGASVDLYGLTGEYRGVRQLVIEKPKHIRPTPGSERLAAMPGGDSGASPRVTIGSINLTTIGHQVRVQGIATDVQPPPRERFPTKVFIEDLSGSIEVVYWEDVTDRIAPENRPVAGQPVEITGVVNEYRGTLQLRVDKPEWVNRQFTLNNGAQMAEVIRARLASEAVTP